MNTGWRVIDGVDMLDDSLYPPSHAVQYGRLHERTAIRHQFIRADGPAFGRDLYQADLALAASAHGVLPCNFASSAAWAASGAPCTRWEYRCVMMKLR